MQAVDTRDTSRHAHRHVDFQENIIISNSSAGWVWSHPGATLNMAFPEGDSEPQLSSGTSNLVQLQIVLKRPAGPEEIVRRVTKDHEVVEVDGFIFKRKRRDPPESPKELLPPAEVDPTTSPITEGSGQGDGQVGHRHVPSPTKDVSPLPPAATHVVSTQEELQYLVHLLLRSELRKLSGSDTLRAQEAAAGVAAKFKEKLSEVWPPEPLCLPQDLSEKGHVQGCRTRLKHILCERIAKLEGEREEWKALEERYRQMMKDCRSTASPEDHSMDTEVLDLEDICDLKDTSKEAHEVIAIKVEALCSMLSKAEQLVAVAEQTCGALQSEFHSTAFRTFAHVDSPKWLIRQLLGPTKE